MTHEHAPRPVGAPAGPEDDHTLPDADTIPTHDTASARRRDTDLEEDPRA